MSPNQDLKSKKSKLRSDRMGREIPFVVLGIDLAGSPRRPTGLCLLRGLSAQTHVAFSDEDILNTVQQAQPDLVPIDAPLSLPKGRKTIHDRAGEHFRDCDRELQRRGIRFFPVTLGPMRMLTERGLELQAKIRGMGYRVIECYPGAAQDVWGIPRQHRDRKSTRLNSSHSQISYAVFCLKKKKKKQ